jgi:hypothetical protein
LAMASGVHVGMVQGFEHRPGPGML